jgi:hypothetical protein
MSLTLSIKKKKDILFVCIMLLVIIGIVYIGYDVSSRRLTYIDHINIGNSDDGEYVTINSGETICQYFYSPYEIIDRVSIKIGTFNRTNHSVYQISVVDDRDNTVMTKNIYTSQVTDGDYYDVRMDGIALSKNERYSVVIKPLNVYSGSEIAFYKSKGAQEDFALCINGIEQGEKVCMSIKLYGYDKDSWWTVLFLFCLAFLICCVIYIYVKKPSIDDELLQFLFVSLIAMLLLFPYARCGGYLDENDNIMGGVLLRKGMSLYKDYVTQHPPFTSYLCSLFALLGAKSIEQFRICAYILYGISVGILYRRYIQQYNRRALFISLLSPVVILPHMIPQSYEIMSDNIHALAMISLLLEFFVYIRDKKLSLNRCIFISICIYTSILSAFVSIYPLFFIGCCFIICEFREQERFDINRYKYLIISLVVPLLLFVIYWIADGSLFDMIDQTYTFNRNIYSLYQNNGYGKSVLMPFVWGILNYGSFLCDSIFSILNMSIGFNAVRFTCSLLMLIIFVESIRNKFYLRSLMIFFFVSLNATRDFGEHGIAAWYLILFMSVYKMVELLGNSKRKCIYFLSILCLLAFLMHPLDYYIYSLQRGPYEISELEHFVENEIDKDEKVIIDLYSISSILIFDRVRIINRNGYFLKWYLDEFENEILTALLREKPKWVIYTPIEGDGILSNYSQVIISELNNHYENYKPENAESIIGLWRRVD